MTENINNSYGVVSYQLSDDENDTLELPAVTFGNGLVGLTCITEEQAGVASLILLDENHEGIGAVKHWGEGDTLRDHNAFLAIRFSDPRSIDTVLANLLQVKQALIEQLAKKAQQTAALDELAEDSTEEAAK